MFCFDFSRSTDFMFVGLLCKREYVSNVLFVVVNQSFFDSSQRGCKKVYVSNIVLVEG